MCSFELSHVHHLFFDHWGLGQAPSIATLFSGGQNQLGHQWRGQGGVSAWLLNMLPCNTWPRLSKKQNQLQPCTCHPGPWQSSKSLVLPTRAPPSACPAVRRGARQGVGHAFPAGPPLQNWGALGCMHSCATLTSQSPHASCPDGCWLHVEPQTQQKGAVASVGFTFL